MTTQLYFPSKQRKAYYRKIFNVKGKFTTTIPRNVDINRETWHLESVKILYPQLPEGMTLELQTKLFSCNILILSHPNIHIVITQVLIVQFLKSSTQACTYISHLCSLTVVLILPGRFCVHQWTTCSTTGLTVSLISKIITTLHTLNSLINFFLCLSH